MIPTLAATVAACLCWGELTADNVAVIAMSESKPSREIAEYYIKMRGLKPSRVFYLPQTPNRDLTRAEWDQTVRPAIRKWLTSRQFDDQIRCLVTTYDVPLRIGAVDPDDPVMLERRDLLLGERRRKQVEIVEVVKRLDQVLAAPNADPRTAPKNSATPQEFATYYNAALRAAEQRRQAQVDHPDAKSAAHLIEQILIIGGGPAARLAVVARSKDQLKLSAEAARRIENDRGEIKGMELGLNALLHLPESAERDLQALGIVQRATGLIGALSWIEQQLELMRAAESYSSFDSELSLVLWPRHPNYRWLPNVLHYGYDRSPMQSLRPTFMVARLEAPTLELTRKMIDTAIEVEKKGLTGTVYFDARGLPANSQRGTIGDYDQSLSRIANHLRENTKLKVVLDENENLFGKDACPDAALYCGWASPSTYVPAFKWKPGAVAYHIGGAEAQSLRSSQGDHWCRQMLQNGVCATLGAVHEPYLASYPRPDEFFSLLASGKFTLAECYARTTPFSSWVMVLIGDPLYNPFKNNPQLKPQSVLLNQTAPAKAARPSRPDASNAPKTKR